MRKADTLVRLAILSVVALLFLFPFVWIVMTSLKTNLEALRAPAQLLPSEFAWRNYLDVLPAMRNFPRQVLNTLVVAGSVTLGQIAVCMMAGYAFARLHFFGRGGLFLLVLATLIVPFEAIYIPIFIMLSQWGWIDTYAALIVPTIASPFAIFLFRQTFLGIPRELEEAMLVDGANRFRIFWSLFVPLSGPAAAAVFVLTFLGEWNDLLKPLVFTTSEEMRTVQLGIVFLDQGAFITEPRIAWLMAGVVLASVVPITLFLLLQRRFVESVAASGLKG